MIKIILALVLCLFVTPVYSADNEIYTQLNYSIDIDDAEKVEPVIGYRKHFGHKQYAGVSLGNTTFSESDEDVDFSFINLDFRKNFTYNYYIEGDIRFHTGENDNIVYNLSAVGQNENIGRLEIFVERSMIDSHAAIDDNIFFLSYGVSADYFITKELTATGVLLRQDATDDNVRLVQLAQLVYSPSQIEGLFLKARAKFRQADFNPVEYFAPDDFKRYDLLLGYGLPFANDNWVIRGEAGPGIQYINGIKESGFEWRVILYGWLTQNIKIEAEYSSTSDSGDSSYNYDWGGITLRYFW